VLIHGDNHLVSAEFELFGGALHDADVGLMRNQPVNVGIGQMGLGQAGPRGFFEHAHSQFENSLTIHLEHRVTQNRTPIDVPRHAQNVLVFAIGMQVGGQNTGLV
jgi:hypothetical protein